MLIINSRRILITKWCPTSVRAPVARFTNNSSNCSSSRWWRPTRWRATLSTKTRPSCVSSSKWSSTRWKKRVACPLVSHPQWPVIFLTRRSGRTNLPLRHCCCRIWPRDWVRCTTTRRTGCAVWSPAGRSRTRLWCTVVWWTRLKGAPACAPRQLTSAPTFREQQ